MSRTFGEATRGSKSVKFHEKGAGISGILLSAPTEQAVTDINTGKPAYWDDEKTRPKYQWVFELFALKEKVCKCDEWCDGGEKNSEYGSEDDDGVRRMYVSSTQQIRAIANAVRSAGVKSGEPEIGSVLTVQFTGFDKSKQQPGRKPPKVYAAGYTRPTDETRAKAREINGKNTVEDDDTDNEQLIHDLLDEVPENKPMSLQDMGKTLDEINT